MKIAKYFLGCLIGASFFVSCNSSEATEEVNTEEVAEEADWEPDMYEPSELVVVMRQMHADNMELKEQIKNGVTPEALPDEYNKILTATATNPDELDQMYYAMAKAWLGEYQELVEASPENALSAYNKMVKTCVSCHQNYCLGPIPKIEKLYIEE